MKAAIYDRAGDPHVLRYADMPDPVPAAGQLLVRVEAISIEGGDTLHRRNAVPPDGGVPGYAAAGTVVALGDGVTGFAVGDRVTTFDFGGSHATLRAVAAATSWKVPAGLDMQVAAAVPCGPGTAALALQLAGVTAGQTVLVQGAAGGVGLAAIQLAHRIGARVMGTGTRAETLERLKGHGLTDAIAIGERSADAQVRALLDGAGADVLIDCVGGPATADGLKALRDGGHAILLGVVGGQDAPISSAELLFHRKTVTGLFLGPIIGEPAIHAMIADLLERALRGELVVPVDAVFPLADAAAAHARAEERGRIGRVFMTA